MSIYEKICFWMTAYFAVSFVVGCATGRLLRDAAVDAQLADS
jgi:hypothetical protein